MRITASIQARLGSTRFPGKVLKTICGKPMLLWQVERIRRSRLVDEVYVATTCLPQDDEIEEFCSKHNILCYRGAENDVLNRIASFIRELNVEIHLECYGDSPLIDPHLIDEFIGYFLKYSGQIDYVSNALKTTYPPGMEVVLYPGHVLDALDRKLSGDDPLREHVGFNITRFPERYRLAGLEAPPCYFRPNIYLEVDTQNDFEVVSRVVSYFVEQNCECFTLSQIIHFLDQSPKLTALNSSIERRWKPLREQVSYRI